MTTKLSDRVRPNSEAAPWVIDEIKKLEVELADERTKRTQIEEMYDLLVANVAPLIDAAREFEVPKNDDSKTIHKIRRIVRYL
jgi:BarA-like signal transduction histidine kinase